jgi:hypothetical protein
MVFPNFPKTDTEVLAAMKTESPLNRARQAFLSYAAKIEQANAQRTPPTIFEVRLMEFEAVFAIAAALGV